jgi:hypothetical protein
MGASNLSLLVLMVLPELVIALWRIVDRAWTVARCAEWIALLQLVRIGSP